MLYPSSSAKLSLCCHCCYHSYLCLDRNVLIIFQSNLKVKSYSQEPVAPSAIYIAAPTCPKEIFPVGITVLGGVESDVVKPLS